ncbi:hypothetical protein Thimo_0520 [Thioflavicoccus mobilis 8321]|uniref:Uncharacterized protein n=1 Tax=Thioflavicoccus mobilis 8321 TaxID=765912 RepID=L0GRI2_9GAMM|nr:hypothetical protein Thimo_0520 [Thioflavicoccus mobilis 8321]
MLAEHPADGMEGLVPREALALQARQRARHGLELFGELILDDDLEAGLEPGVGQFDPRGAVECLDEGDAGLRIERQPLLRIGGRSGS